jgi:hypothetical protein
LGSLCVVGAVVSRAGLDGRGGAMQSAMQDHSFSFSVKLRGELVAALSVALWGYCPGPLLGPPYLL